MKKTALLFIILLSCTGFLYAREQTLLLRQPHVHQDKVVFVYAGDLYSVPITGGAATKLTSFDGMEIFPKFSPDGKWIAFSGQYAGTRQIYIIPSEGGIPKRVTWYPDVGEMPPRGGYDHLPYDWTPDGKHILVRANRTPHGERIGKFFLVDPFTESLAKPLQIPEGGPATLSPDGAKLAYSIKSREFRTWKRYKAGFAMNVWIYDLENNAIEKITDFPGTDNFPMWVGETIYFNSDRDKVDSNDPRTLNIFAYDMNSKTTRQITRFSDYDVMFPSRGNGGIVFENGGRLYHLDTETENIKEIPVIIRNDMHRTAPVYKNVSEWIQSYAVSPSGKRALFAARGDIFTVPEKHGPVHNITHTQAVREISVRWSPDGKHISYLAEAGDYYELFIREYNTQNEPVQLTANTGAWITGYVWSNDSKHILLSDKKNRLHLLNVSNKSIKIIDQGFYSDISNYSWSPDNMWVVYTKNDINHLSSIWLYSVDQNKTYRLTKDKNDETSPVFSRDGKTLSFVSRRDFNWGSRQFDAKLYIVNLSADEKSPFAPLYDDEISDNSNDKPDKKTDKIQPVKIDVEGFADRVIAYPLGTGHYRVLESVENGLTYLRGGTLYIYNIKDRKESKILDQIRSYAITPDAKKLIYQSGNDYGIIDVRAGQDKDAGKLALDEMEMRIDPRVEWKQIYTDAWRIMRDWFYDPGLHGVDWKAMHDKYLPLVDHVAHRSDLDYILGELIGELNAGHTYVNSGDMHSVKRVPVGLLGCEFEADGNYYRISRIYNGENWNDELRSPLNEPGIQVNVGDYLLAIDGIPVTTKDNPYRHLENKSEKIVRLTVNSRPEEKGSRNVTVKTIASETALRHYNWVLRNHAIVDSLSNGRIGYIYVPNTSFPGFREFYKGWMSQFYKDGLIIDDRYNGGGSLPHPMVLEMAYPVLHYWARRNLPLYSTPMRAHEGPKVMLINGRSSSGGDALPAYFKELKLGPLMGQTTWGGLIGYSGSPRFADGGGFAVPQFSYVNRDGEWDVEYYGVHPDIPVFDDPTLIQAGREPMLEEAVKYILEQLEKKPPVKVEKPEGPDRS